MDEQTQDTGAPPKSPAKRAWKLALEDMRIKYSGEIENTIKTLVEIRDDIEAANKDRTDAGYKLARLLGMGITGEHKPSGGEELPYELKKEAIAPRMSEAYEKLLKDIAPELDDDD